ncbi:hypothetical protein ABZ319_07205 [Nocardia sp. NPDC005978]|uniref:poly(ethylene terephthalate) hydrolase family protein n=1 Tax=Nocardia sp. NPDC005978 TaxID=3156725 RepID=UPI0033AF4AE1
MMKSSAGRRVLALVAAFGIAAGVGGVRPATATADDIAPGTTAQSLFDTAGPHGVTTSTVTDLCQESVFGMIAHIVVHLSGNVDDLRCTQAFPYGLQSPIGVNTYFPADIADLDSAPLILFEGGITSNPGQYDAIVRQWTGHGFVVVVSYDFFNSLAYVPAIGLATAVAQQRDPSSPLFGKIDLSRTVLAGHSGGGQATLQAAALFPPIAGAIDPALRMIGALAIEPGPLALGSSITVPTLFLTGYNDVVVPDFAWVRWWEYNLVSAAPAWIANARGVSHFSPVDGPGNYRSSGAAVAWLRYIALGDDTAARFFTGPDWRLRDDPTYYSVERNPRANALP